jgi:hypothetical protein
VFFTKILLKKQGPALQITLFGRTQLSEIAGTTIGTVVDTVELRN